MNTGKLHLRAALAACALALAACGQSQGAPATDTGAVGALGGSVADAYAGAEGVQLTALRLWHLKGYVIAAEYLTESDHMADAAAIVADGLRETYDSAPDQFGQLNIAVIRAAANGAGLNRAEMMQRLRDAEHEIERAAALVGGIDHGTLAARMLDITTALYANVGRGDAGFYSASRGAAFAARDALLSDQDVLRRENPMALARGVEQFNRLIDLYPGAVPGENITPNDQLVAQARHVREVIQPLL